MNVSNTPLYTAVLSGRLTGVPRDSTRCTANLANW